MYEDMLKKTHNSANVKFDTEAQVGDTFGSVLSRYMMDYGCTEAELADAVGVDISSIKKYKSNLYKPTVPNLVKICLALHLFYERAMYLISLSGKSLPTRINGERYKWELGIIFYTDWSVQQCYNESIKRFDNHDRNPFE